MQNSGEQRRPDDKTYRNALQCTRDRVGLRQRFNALTAAAFRRYLN
jgi:hypothetical protein